MKNLYSFVRYTVCFAALTLAAGCASFNSGDILVSRTDLRRMLDDKQIRPFSDIRVTWRNFPYQNPTDSIGEGPNPPPPQSILVPGEDLAWLREQSKTIFEKAGLYSATQGSGTLKIALITYNRWTYREILKSFLVDTGYIFLIPASMRVSYQLAFEFNGPDGKTRVEEIGQNKTTFHLLMFPLYPFFSPGAKEHSMLKNMLWKSAADIYLKMRENTDKTTATAAVPPAEPSALLTPGTTIQTGIPTQK